MSNSRQKQLNEHTVSVLQRLQHSNPAIDLMCESNRQVRVHETENIKQAQNVLHGGVNRDITRKSPRAAILSRAGVLKK